MNTTITRLNPEQLREDRSRRHCAGERATTAVMVLD